MQCPRFGSTAARKALCFQRLSTPFQRLSNVAFQTTTGRGSNSGSTKSSGSKQNRGSYGGHSSSGRATSGGGGSSSVRGSSSVHDDVPEVDVELHADGMHTLNSLRASSNTLLLADE
jgi:hypothetical protein